MNIITGKTGVPHVTSQQQRDIHMGIFGTGNYVLPVGQQFAYELLDSNTIRIKDGVMVMQGCAASIDAGLFEDLTIENGTPGENRTDLIVARYEKSLETGFESVILKVLQGTETDTPIPLAGEIRNGTVMTDFVLYQVSVDFLDVTITPMFKTSQNTLNGMRDMESKILWSGNSLMGPVTEVSFPLLTPTEQKESMASDQNTVVLSENISAQNKGIVLVFASNENDRSYWINCHFVPKEVVTAFLGMGHSFEATTSAMFTLGARKFIYINDNSLVGHQDNIAAGTGASGVKYDNTRMKLRMVIGV